MINDILAAAANKLNEEFENVKIYNEAIKQGFKTPCFCISPYSVSDCLYRDKRYKYTASVEIRYYAESRADKIDVVERLFRCLEYIEPEDLGLVMGSNMECEICDKYYKFKVSYEFFYVRREEKDIMGSVKLELKL